MMPPPQYASPFPPIDLSVDEREMLIRTANELVNQAQEKYEWFLWQDRERVDADRWRLVRDQDDMSVYVDRRFAVETGNRDMQCLLTTGSIPGSLHDAMYGILNLTTDAMKIKTAYLQDTLLAGAVLETILSPTPDLPFQSLALRWFVKGVPLHVRAVTKKHGDNVIIEATGMRKLYDGKQVGFHLMHSVNLAEAPLLPQYQRFNLSTCTIWRQTSRQLVQAYVTTFVEFPDSFMTPLQVKSAADVFVSGSKTVYCAQMKKLAWLLEQKATTKQLDKKDTVTDVVKAGCSECGSQCPSVFKCTSGCALCSKPTCARCRVKNEMFTLGPDRELSKTKVRVCKPCMKTVDQMDAAVVAQQEAMASEQRLDASKLKAVAGRETRLSTSSVTSSASTEIGTF